MSKRDKLIKRFLTMPSDFNYEEVVRLLGYFGFTEVIKGKTSGSRVKFENIEGIPIMFHKPHPNGIMKMYQLKQIRNVLEL